MPSRRTEITEIATALGMVAPSLGTAFSARPPELMNVAETTWSQLVEAWSSGEDQPLFEMAFSNGQAFLNVADGLRGRRPTRVEWKGPHRPPGDDVIPADLRVDHVFLISCKYLSKITINTGPSRLFERLLIGEQRDRVNWFLHVAEAEFEAFYGAAVRSRGLSGLPTSVADLSSAEQVLLRQSLRDRSLPVEIQGAWDDLCRRVSAATAHRWSEVLGSDRNQLRLLWKMLRVSGASYFVLGAAPKSYLRLRIDSAWDWMQTYELRQFQTMPDDAGQPQVSWTAVVRRRDDQSEIVVNGHVEIRWSHGRFRGMPEAKVYLDTPHTEVPGYNALA